MPVPSRIVVVVSLCVKATTATKQKDKFKPPMVNATEIL